VDNPYQAPAAPVLDLPGSASKNFKLFKISGIALATFLGSPIAGGILLAKNFSRLGKPRQAKMALIYSSLAAFVLLAIAFLIPDRWHVPNYPFLLVQLLTMQQVAKNYQEADIREHEAQAGAMASNWLAAGIGLLTFLALMLAIFAVIVAATALGWAGTPD